VGPIAIKATPVSKYAKTTTDLDHIASVNDRYSETFSVVLRLLD